MGVVLEQCISELLTGHDAFFLDEHLRFGHEVLLEIDGLLNASVDYGLVAS